MNNSFLYHLIIKDPEKYIAIYGFFSNYPIDDFIIINDSALIEGRSDRKWKHLIVSNNDELNRLLERVDLRNANFYGVENWVKE